MYFSEREQQSVPAIGKEAFEDRLRGIAKELRARPERYRAFGPYWWLIKGSLRRRYRRRDWFAGPAEDRQIMEEFLPGPKGSGPERPEQESSESRDARPRPEENLRLLSLAVAYYDTEAADGEPLSELHILEGRRGAFLYRIQDPDASRQLDLFDEVVNEEQRREKFLKRAATFLPGPWLQAGDRSAAAGESHRAVACYKRALAVAHDTESRLQGWLRIGTTLQEAGHPEKAIVAFEQAYRRGQEGWILGLIGQASLAAGRYGEAVRQFSAALESMPGNPEYRAGLDAARSAVASQDQELAIG